MPDEGRSPDRERRRAPRLDAVYEVRIRVEVYGSDRRAEPFFASGVTVNVSRVGVLATVDDSVQPGERCRVMFVDVGEAIRPRHVAGEVVRCRARPGDARTYELAVAFDEALITLEPDAS